MTSLAKFEAQFENLDSGWLMTFDAFQELRSLLTRARSRSGLTYRQLSFLLDDVTPMELSAFERGEASLRSDVFFAMTLLLKVDPQIVMPILERLAAMHLPEGDDDRHTPNQPLM